MGRYMCSLVSPHVFCERNIVFPVTHNACIYKQIYVLKFVYSLGNILRIVQAKVSNKNVS